MNRTLLITSILTDANVLIPRFRSLSLWILRSPLSLGALFSLVLAGNQMQIPKYQLSGQYLMSCDHL